MSPVLAGRFFTSESWEALHIPKCDLNKYKPKIGNKHSHMLIMKTTFIVRLWSTHVAIAFWYDWWRCIKSRSVMWNGCVRCRLLCNTLLPNVTAENDFLSQFLWVSGLGVVFLGTAGSRSLVRLLSSSPQGCGLVWRLREEGGGIPAWGCWWASGPDCTGVSSLLACSVDWKESRSSWFSKGRGWHQGVNKGRQGDGGF